MKPTTSPHESKTRILDAALHVIRSRGYAASTIDDLCHAAELTKGSFFHHFKGKEELALAAADHFAAMADGLFATAPYRAAADPVDRLLGYVDFRIGLLNGALPRYTCLLGTMVQETYETHPAIRTACERHMGDHVAMLAADVAAAKSRYAPDAPWSAESVALFIQSVLQGAFVMAKANGGPDGAVASLGHLRRYLESLFDRSVGRS